MNNLKSNIISLIQETNNEAALQVINEFLSALNTDINTVNETQATYHRVEAENDAYEDWLDLLPKHIKQRLQISLEQANRKEFISHQDAMKHIDSKFGILQ